jgi:hypothetical protein
MGLFSDIFSIFTGYSAAREARSQSRAAQALAERQQASQEEAIKAGLEIAKNQDARSQQQFDRYTNTFVPIEDKFLAEATKPINPDFAAGLASADAAKQVGVQRGVIARTLARNGVAPNSGAAVDATTRLGLGEAALRAGGATMARRAAATDTLGRLEAASQLGRNLPSSALAFSSAAGAGLNNAQAGYGQMAGVSSARQAAYNQAQMAAMAQVGKGAASLESDLASFMPGGGIPGITG